MATEYGIRSIPTVMIFKNGQKMDAVIGASCLYCPAFFGFFWELSLYVLGPA